jgi:hypothetical protein
MLPRHAQEPPLGRISLLQRTQAVLSIESDSQDSLDETRKGHPASPWASLLLCGDAKVGGRAGTVAVSGPSARLSLACRQEAALVTHGDQEEQPRGR